MANPRKPTQLKVVAGTDRPDRAAPPCVEMPLVESAPPAPDWLPNAHAIKEWNRLAPILVNNKLLTDGSLSPLAVLCSLHGEIVHMWSRQVSPTGHMLAQYRALINDFGLTPVAQGKVRPSGETKNPGNRFAKNGKRAS